MNTNRFPTRRENLLAKLREKNAPAVLITNPTNVTYLTGFTGDSSYLLLGPGVEIMISDTRYDTQLRDECPGLRTHIRTSKTLLADATAEVLKGTGLKSLAFEKNSVTVEQHEEWREKVAGLELVGVSGWVEELREVKDEDELGEIRKAIDQAQRGFAAVRAWMTPEMTESEVAHELEHLMRRFGVRRAAFEIIVAVGPRAALPHARPTSVRLKESPFVLIDWGATSPGGYRSDLTRVLTTASIPPKVEELYRVVLTAQQTAIRLIRPGAKCSDVDAAARKVIEDAGYGPFFGHGLGHGIGLDIHEGPRFAATSKGELKPGMVITVEPGIYLPDVAGVRIEDDVLVTPDGHEVLTSAPREWETARWM